MDVETITLAGDKWVAGMSLYKAIGESGNFTGWMNYQKKRLKNGIDYIPYMDDFLFTEEAALKIYNKKKPQRKTDGVKRSRYGYPLDEYGLPILPPEKHSSFINPYRV
jgi:hypothetical protein